MTTIVAIATFAIIGAIAWGGMRLMQRTTGCAVQSSSAEIRKEDSAPNRE